MAKNVHNYGVKPNDYYGNREEMLRFIPHGVSKALDVGCGEGDFGKVLKSESSVEVWGLEMFKDVAEKARGKLDKVIVADIENEEVKLPENYFDCIIFNDVLEHFRSPWCVLDKLKKNLNADGVIVASIPNVRYFKNIKRLVLGKEWEYVDSGILDRTHLRFFTYKSIERMFQESGYDVITLAGINSEKFTLKFGLLNRLLLNALDDMQYVQFACVARKKDV